VLNNYTIGTDSRCGTVQVDLYYPRSWENPYKNIQIGLVDVRASDDIRVSYDFVRDGWVIEQGTVFEWHPTDEVCDPCWVEVAFIKAWGSDPREGNL